MFTPEEMKMTPQQLHTYMTLEAKNRVEIRADIRRMVKEREEAGQRGDVEEYGELTEALQEWAQQEHETTAHLAYQRSLYYAVTKARNLKAAPKPDYRPKSTKRS